MALLERQITSSTHDFQPPHELRPGRVGDKYLLDLAATVDLAPSQHEGVCLRIHLNGNRVQVDGPASLVVKATFSADADAGTAADPTVSSAATTRKSTFPTVTHVWEDGTGALPVVPAVAPGRSADAAHYLGGYSDDGSHFSFLYRLAPNEAASATAASFSFSGLQLAFKHRVNRPMTSYRLVTGYLELSRLTLETADPGAISNIVSVKTWNHRNEVVKEIVASEISYLQGLTTLVEVYKRPLAGSAASMKPILKPEEVDAIFSNIELICNVNKELLQQLEQRVDTWSSTQLVGDVFLKMGPYLKTYSQYCNNYPAAIALYNRRRQLSSKFSKFIVDAKSLSGNLELSAFLLLPVQRNPRYRMLLDDLLKHTWVSHPDYENIRKAAKLVAEITEFINNGITKAENAAKILDIQNRFVGNRPEDLIQPSRRFVREGEMVKIAAGLMNRRFFILFNDAIVYAKMKGKRNLQWKGKWDLSSSWLRDLPNSPKLRCAFQIITTKKTYTIVTRNEDMKRSWMDQIGLQIASVHKLNPNVYTQDRAKRHVDRPGFLGMFTKQVLVENDGDFDPLPNETAPVSPLTSTTSAGSLTSAPISPSRTSEEDDDEDDDSADDDDGFTIAQLRKPTEKTSTINKVNRWQQQKMTLGDLVQGFDAATTVATSTVSAPTIRLPKTDHLVIPPPPMQQVADTDDMGAIDDLKKILEKKRGSVYLPSEPSVEAAPASLPQAESEPSIFKEPVRVYLTDRTFKVFQVSHTATAGDLLAVVLTKVGVPSSERAHYRLFEVDASLADRASRRLVGEKELPLAIKLGWGSSGLMEFHILKTAITALLPGLQQARPPTEPPPAAVLVDASYRK